MNPLVGLLLASLITATATSFYVPKIANLQNQQFDDRSAQQFAVFVNAAQRFIESDRVKLVEEFVLVPGPKSIDVSALKNAGALPAAFEDRNTFDQKHALLLIRNRVDPRQVEGLAVTYGGETMTERENVRLALSAGFRTGLVHKDRVDQAWGASGLWRVNLSDFQGGSVLPDHRAEPGHLVALVSTMQSDYRQLSELRAVGVLSSGEIVRKPYCGTRLPQIFALPVQFSDNGAGYPVLGLQAYAEETPDKSGWLLRLQLFRENPSQPGTDMRVELDAVHGRMAVFTTCE